VVDLLMDQEKPLAGGVKEPNHGVSDQIALNYVEIHPILARQQQKSQDQVIVTVAAKNEQRQQCCISW
jgi:hypothetical protein